MHFAAADREQDVAAEGADERPPTCSGTHRNASGARSAGLASSEDKPNLGKSWLMTAIRRRSPGCQAGLASFQLEHAELIAEREYLGAKLAIDHARSPDEPRATQPAQPESVTPGRCLSAANRPDAEGITAIPSSPKPEHAFW